MAVDLLSLIYISFEQSRNGKLEEGIWEAFWFVLVTSITLVIGEGGWKDEVDWACRMPGSNADGICVGRPEGKDQSEGLDLGGRIILKSSRDRMKEEKL